MTTSKLAAERFSRSDGITTRGLLLLACLLIGACASTLKPVGAHTMIGDKRARTTVLVLDREARGTPNMIGSATRIFPAGRYTAVHEDRYGVYFKSPGKIYRQGLTSGVEEGGLYLEFKSPGKPRFYILSDKGVPQKHSFDRGVSYRLLNR